MATTGGRTDPAVIDTLLAEPYRFDFFQAVRLLESQARHDGSAQPVGDAGPPRREVVNFRAQVSLGFPAGSISALQPSAPAGDGGSAPAEMTVPFLGLVGPSGVLPDHYTQLVIDRCHVKNKDYTLRDYLDLFHHRLISLFYRAWEKYRFPFAYERRRLAGDPERIDDFSFALSALVGLGTSGLQGRLAFDDDAIVYYGGHFAHYPRSAIALEEILNDYFEIPVELEQFRGQWLYLSDDELSWLSTPKHPAGLNQCLGVSAIAGNRVWDVQSMFRLRLGPLDYRQFLEFMPIGRRLLEICQMVRLYVGQEFDFDVQVLLKARDVPYCKLPATPADASRLGWNAWIHASPFDRDAEDAVFRLDHV